MNEVHFEQKKAPQDKGLIRRRLCHPFDNIIVKSID